MFVSKPRIWFDPGMFSALLDEDLSDVGPTLQQQEFRRIAAATSFSELDDIPVEELFLLLEQLQELVEKECERFSDRILRKEEKLIREKRRGRLL